MADGRFDKLQGSPRPPAGGRGVRDVARAQFPDRSPSSVPFRGWLMVGAVTVAVALVSGAGVFANVGEDGSARVKSIEASIAERSKQLASLDEERKRREDALADIQRRANAKQSEFAEAGERVAALEERRGALQRQVAELAGPVSPSGAEPAVLPDDPEIAPADQAPQEAVAPTPQARGGESTAKVDPAPAKPNDDLKPRPRDVVASAVAPRAAVPLPPVTPVSVERSSEDDRSTATTAAGQARDMAEAAGSVRVFIHVRSADPAARSRARAVAAELRRRGVSVAEIRGVRLPVRRDSVRFFYDADRGAVPGLQEAVRDASSSAGAPPVAQDYRSYGAPPRPGTIELWLS